MNINLLILGKSGAGKSTLLNYLWGKNIATTGIGKPVTPKSKNGKTGIYVHSPVRINGHDLVISDSWGLEADKADEWLRIVLPELEKHESSPDVEDWFHVVLYCIGAPGARVEPFEIKEVATRLQKAGHTLIFALTKADRASKDELSELKNLIQRDCPNNGGVIFIESLNEELRGGRTTIQHGKDELIKAITKNMIAKLQIKLENRYLEKCRELCGIWKEEVLNRYDEEAGLFTRTSTTMAIVERDAKARMETLNKSLTNWHKEAIKKINDFQKAFGEVVSEKTSIRKKSIPPLSIEINEWNGVTHAANAVMYMIPIVGQLWPFFSEGVHRRELEERLDEIIGNIISNTEDDIASAALKRNSESTSRKKSAPKKKSSGSIPDPPLPII